MNFTFHISKKMKKFKCLIIDDEFPARSLVREYLTGFDNFEIIGEAANGFEGVQLINELNPDVVFLDIQMPKLNGFELLELIDKDPYIIFSTAFDQYAIRAFEKNAIDYLLKPYSKERFALTVQKISEKELEKGSGHEPDRKKMLDSLDDSSEYLFRVAIRTGNQIKVIPVEAISHIEADDDYVRIYSDGHKYLKEKTMKYFETHLDPRQFVRIHRSAIINIVALDKLERYEKDSYLAILKDQTRLRVSANGYKALKEVLKF